MKIDRHDQAKILSSDELSQLFNQGLKTTRDRALFGVCLYTGARIAEACSLHTKWMPKPGSHPPDSATKPCMNLWTHTAPQ